MIIAKPHLLTQLDIWFPKYHSESGGWEVWLGKNKVNHSSGVIIVNFTKAKHLKGQRFCIRRAEVERCPIGTNGRISVYRVPFDKLEGWETATEVRDLAINVFPD